MPLQVSEPLILKLESTREGACYQLDAGEGAHNSNAHNWTTLRRMLWALPKPVRQ